MEIRFYCTYCGHLLEVDEFAAELDVACGNCGKQVTVPTSAREPAAPVPITARQILTPRVRTPRVSPSGPALKEPTGCFMACIYGAVIIGVILLIVFLVDAPRVQKQYDAFMAKRLTEVAEPDDPPSNRQRTTDLVVKGLYLGMPLTEALEICNTSLFINEGEPVISREPFVIEDNKICSRVWIPGVMIFDFAITGDKNEKVERIAFNGFVVDLVFNTAAVSAEDFVRKFIASYRIPEMKSVWEMGFIGWEYYNPAGWKLRISDKKDVLIQKVAKPSEMHFN